jgi:hypothetical protein
MGEPETGGQQPEETPVPDDQAPATADPNASSTPSDASPKDGDDGGDDGGIDSDVIFHG